MRIFPVIFLLILSFLSSCDDDTDYTLKYEGDGGVEIPVNLSALTPEVDATLEVYPYSGNFIVDTGAPLNLVDIGHYDYQVGYYSIDATAIGMHFPSLPMVFENIFDDNLDIAGILGSTLVSSFNWELNYTENYMVLHTGNLPLELESGHAVSFQMLGGGRYRLTNGDTLDVGATRYIVMLNIEDSEASALLDTGATYLVLSETFLDSLPDVERVSHGMTQIVTVYGVINAPLIEVKYASFADSPVDTKVNDILTIIVDDDFFSDLRTETGKQIKALLGGSYMQYFHMRFNMNDRILWVGDPVLSKKSAVNYGVTRWPVHLEN